MFICYQTALVFIGSNFIQDRFHHNLGLGLDWGTSFTTPILRYINRNFVEETTTPPKAEVSDPKVCIFYEKKVLHLSGKCTLFGSCRIGQVSHYGSNCQSASHGSSCSVESSTNTIVEGVCSPGGHCQGDDGHIRLHHEACNIKSKIKDRTKVDRVKNFIRSNMSSKLRSPVDLESLDTNNLNQTQPNQTISQCRGLYNPPAFKKLENICTDCYNLYKEAEVFTFCMSNCFDSNYFLSCVKSLMLEEDMVQGLVKMVGKK